MEIFASGDMQDKIEKKLLTGINDTDCFLVEFPFDEEPERIGEQLEILRDMGKIPLIAHPERYFCTQEFPALIYGWLQMGCLTQVNKGSILGRFGRRVQQTAEILLGNDLATCIASDAHSPYRRTTYMRDIQVVLEEYWGEETAYRLLVKNPEKIIGRGKIPVHGRPPERKRWFFRK